jgi:hypothetical protein
VRKQVKVAWSRGLVKISASWSCLGTWIKAIFPFTMLSLRKWYLTSMCLVLEWSTEFLRTMCGLRTGGWSLPGVMSDWQCCVDWFLAKYCRCRLRLDLCWCRWRTSTKGRCRWGLQVWRRQVGLVRGTRWPAGSSTGRMVARTVRWSRGWFLGWAIKPRSCRDFVGAKSWLVIGGGCIKFARFGVVHQKTMDYSAEPQSRGRRPGMAIRPKPAWPIWSRGHASWSQGLRRGDARFGVVHQKTIGLLSWATKPRPKTGRGCQAKTGLTDSEQRTRVGIARFASRLREVQSPGIRLMVLQRQIPKVPLVGVYPSLCSRGILVFRLASI